MDFITLRNEFINELKRLPYAKLHSGNRWLGTRCPFCNDSKKHNNTTHFNISIPKDSESIIFMKCFQPECQLSKGRPLTVKDLRFMGIHNPDVVKFVTMINKNNRNSNKKYYKKMVGYSLLNIPSRDNDSYEEEKLEYINNRLGINLTYQDAADMKIVLSLFTLARINRVPLNHISKAQSEYFNYKCVGFLSKDNSYIIFRNAYKKDYKVFNLLNEDHAHKYYSIPNNIDIMSTEPIHIHLAEGVMDILGVYYHIMNQDKENNIYIAVAGASYDYVIKTLIKNGFFNAIFHIYSDDGIDINYYRKMKNDYIGSHKFMYPMYVYYNTLEKDCGVTKDRIKLKQSII